MIKQNCVVENNPRDMLVGTILKYIYIENICNLYLDIKVIIMQMILMHINTKYTHVFSAFYQPIAKVQSLPVGYMVSCIDMAYHITM